MSNMKIHHKEGTKTQFIRDVIYMCLFLTAWYLVSESERVVHVYAGQDKTKTGVLLFMRLVKWVLIIAGSMIVFHMRHGILVALVAFVATSTPSLVAEGWRARPQKFLIQNLIPFTIWILAFLDEKFPGHFFYDEVLRRALNKVHLRDIWILMACTTFLVAFGVSPLYRRWIRSHMDSQVVFTVVSIVFIILLSGIYILWKHVGLQIERRQSSTIQKQIPAIGALIVVCAGVALTLASHARKAMIGVVHDESRLTDRQKMALCCTNIAEEAFLFQTHSSKWTRKLRPFLTGGFIHSVVADRWKKAVDDDAGLTEIVQNVFSRFSQLSGAVVVKAIFLRDPMRRVLGLATVLSTSDMYIFLRGTNSIMEWIGNLCGSMHTFSPTDLSTKHVQINAMAHMIHQHLDPLIVSSRGVQKSGSPRRIFISGHSRGATLALYLGLQMVRHIPPSTPIHLLLFACPPLTDIESYLSFLKKGINKVEVVIHKNDILGWLNSFYPCLTSFCPSINHTGQVRNIRLTSTIDSPLNTRRFLVDRDLTISTKHVVLRPSPAVLHDLVDYINLAQERKEK